MINVIIQLLKYFQNTYFYCDIFSFFEKKIVSATSRVHTLEFLRTDFSLGRDFFLRWVRSCVRNSEKKRISREMEALLEPISCKHSTPCPGKSAEIPGGLGFTENSQLSSSIHRTWKWRKRRETKPCLSLLEKGLWV